MRSQVLIHLIHIILFKKCIKNKGLFYNPPPSNRVENILYSEINSNKFKTAILLYWHYIKVLNPIHLWALFGPSKIKDYIQKLVTDMPRDRTAKWCDLLQILCQHLYVCMFLHFEFLFRLKRTNKKHTEGNSYLSSMKYSLLCTFPIQTFSYLYK